MKLYARPFLYITPLFAAGIVLGDFFHVASLLSWVLLGILLVTITLFLLKKSLTTLMPLSAILGLIFLGALSIEFQRFDDQTIAKGTADVEAAVLINVLEIDESESLWKRMVCETVAVVGESGYVPHQEKILVYTNAPAVSVYDQLMIQTDFKEIENKGNPGEFDAKRYWNNKNIYSIAFMDEIEYMYVGHNEPFWFDQIRNKASDRLDTILGTYLKESNLAVAKALILGDKSLLRPELKRSFSSAGAMHVLAVSGLHVGIILELLLFLFGRFPRIFSKNAAVIIALVILWTYAAVVGFSPSVVRATFMFTLLAVAKMMSRQSNSLNVLLFSACIMLFTDPLLLYDIGFQLSYLAMAGILLLYRPIESTFYISNRILKKIWQGTAVGISAQLFTLPVTLYYFHQFPNYFMLTNVGMMVFAGLVLGAGLLLFATSWMASVGQVIAVILGMTLTTMILFVETIENIPGAVSFGFTIPWYVILAAYLLLFTLIITKSTKLLLRSSLVLCFGLLIFVQFLRYQNMTTDEFVIFNSNKLIMAIKQDESIICIHNASNGKTDKLKYITEAYSKVRPGKSKYIKLGKGETTIHLKNGSIKFVKYDNGFHATVLPSGENVFIRTRTTLVPFEDSMIIDMPYLPHANTLHNLRSGAYQISLEKN
ncbi:MAG: competence protein ComEC [Crocinitomicaceae bacterium]|jgi:competence protein ComEC